MGKKSKSRNVAKILAVLALLLALAGSASAWFNVDVGTPTPGSASYDEDTATWTVTGNGHDIWGSSDNFHYVYRYLGGDGEIIARVASLGPGTDPWAKAGVMIRDTLSPGSKFAAVYVTPGYGCRFQARLVTDGSATSDTPVATNEQKFIVAPYWVKLERVGNAFNTYYCNNPATDSWHLMVWSPQTIVMADPVCIGLAVTSHAHGELRTATFDNVTFTGDIFDVQVTAHSPAPADEITDVPRDVILGWTPGPFAVTHDVYFGTTFADVNDADRTNPLGVLASQNQDANTYDPGRLEFSQTYYWRVDEVNAPPDFTIFKGRVWQFTVEPVAYPLVGISITATASSQFNENTKPENTINGSGLDDNDLHSMEEADIWVSSMTGPQPTWIQYEFNQLYKLHQMWVWNSNQMIESILGFGFKEVTIEYSSDGVNWATLDTVEFARAPGLPGYAYNTTVALGAVPAKYVKLTANSNWGGIVPQYGLSEVRFFHIPVFAREPEPASGTTDVNVDNVTLSWRAGREAATHNVYFSTDEQAVIDETISPVSIPAGSSYANYNTGPLELGQSYYWKVNEVNEAETPTTWQGDIWSFTTVVPYKKGPYLIYPGDNTQMTVLWQLKMTRDCTLEWGTDTNYGNSVTSSEYGSDHQHQYTITSLTPGTKYYYQVAVDGNYLTGSFLAALAADAQNVKFLAYGDCRTNVDIHDAVNAQMIATYTADPAYQTFTMLTGDWVLNGDNESHWTDQFFNRSWSNTMEMQANLPINGCIGNHEGSGIVFEKYWPYPYESGGQYWSFDYGPAHIVVLDQYTTSYAPESPQYTWLQNDLANATAPWKFIQLHEPGWSAGIHANNSEVQDYIQPLCETYGVAIVFAGHNHYYARAMVNGVVHITTGGGGAPLYPPEAGHPNIVAYDQSNHFCKIDIQGGQLTFEAVRLDGSVIDTFTMGD